MTFPFYVITVIIAKKVSGGDPKINHVVLRGGCDLDTNSTQCVLANVYRLAGGPLYFKANCGREPLT